MEEDRKLKWRKVYLSDMACDDFFKITKENISEEGSHSYIILDFFKKLLDDPETTDIKCYLDGCSVEYYSPETDEEYHDRIRNTQLIKDYQDRANIMKMKQLMDTYKDIAKKYLENE